VVVNTDQGAARVAATLVAGRVVLDTGDRLTVPSASKARSESPETSRSLSGIAT